jgi:hypothetical protein
MYGDEHPKTTEKLLRALKPDIKMILKLLQEDKYSQACDLVGKHSPVLWNALQKKREEKRRIAFNSDYWAQFEREKVNSIRMATQQGNWDDAAALLRLSIYGHPPAP